MRRALLPSLCAALVLGLASNASAAGPVLQGGLMRTKLADSGDLRYQGLDGGAYKIGFEVGSHHWRSEWAFNQTVLSGYSEGADHRLTLTGFSYQLAFLLFEKGITPYLGVGGETGLASMRETRPTGYDYAYTTDEGTYLRPYAVLGLRLQFGFGLGVRAEVTGSYYGELVALSTNVGLSYTW